MKRTPLKRSTKPIPKRRANPRRGPLRCPAYRAWLRTLGCMMLGCGAQFADAAHTLNNGMHSKGPDSSCVPLCRKHHREYDTGRMAFERKYTINMPATAGIFWGIFWLQWEKKQ